MPIISGGGGGGGLPLTGGTITGPLVIDVPTAGGVPLTVECDAATGSDLTVDFPGAPNTGRIDVNVAADGTATADRAVLGVTDGSGGNMGLGSHFGLYLQPRASNVISSTVLEVTDANGNDTFNVLVSGTVVFARNTVIPDGDLAPSQFGFWLDDTPAATKLMVKAKDSGGAVRTAAIVLV